MLQRLESLCLIGVVAQSFELPRTVYVERAVITKFFMIQAVGKQAEDENRGKETEKDH